MSQSAGSSALRSATALPARTIRHNEYFPQKMTGSIFSTVNSEFRIHNLATLLDKPLTATP